MVEGKIREAVEAVARARHLSGFKRKVLFGCLATFPLDEIDLSDFVRIGPGELSRLNDTFEHRLAIERVTPGRIDSALFTPTQSRMSAGDTYLQIAHGCENGCSYCNIKLAKGPVRSIPVGRVVSELRAALQKGSREVALLADDCGSYGRDVGTDLPALLQALCAVDDAVQLKIGYIFPRRLIDLYPRLRPFIAAGRISYLNLPLQSGSQRILALMNRDYDIGRVLEIVQDIRSLPEPVWLYSHFMLNFPTETREDLERSLEASRGFDECLFISYSDNPLTAASGLGPKVCSEEAEERLRIVERFLASAGNGLLVRGHA